VFLRGADHVHRILRILPGSAPADLPFEMSSTFKLGVNTRMARALGVKIPQAPRVRADAIIEYSI
jgi:ABC-type uncharacterized transport system substrate-binding protein